MGGGDDGGATGPPSIIQSCHSAYSVVAPSTPSWRSPSFSHAERRSALPPKVPALTKPSARAKAWVSKVTERDREEEVSKRVKAGPSDAGSLPRELKESIARLGKQDEIAGDPLLRAQILADYWKMMGRSDAASAAKSPRSASGARSVKPFVETHVDEEGHVHHYHYIPVAASGSAASGFCTPRSAASHASRATPRVATSRAATPRAAPSAADDAQDGAGEVIYWKDGAKDPMAIAKALGSETTTADSASGQKTDDSMQKLTLEKLLLNMRKCHFDVLNRAKPPVSKHSVALTPRGRISRAADIPGLRESSPTYKHKKSYIGMDLRRYK
jgi:hypothetical protein